MRTTDQAGSLELHSAPTWSYHWYPRAAACRPCHTFTVSKSPRPLACRGHRKQACSSANIAWTTC